MLHESQQRKTAERHEANLQAANSVRIKQAAQVSLKRSQAQDVQQTLVLQKDEARAQQRAWRETQLKEQMHVHEQWRQRSGLVPTACRVQGSGYLT